MVKHQPKCLIVSIFNSESLILLSINLYLRNISFLHQCEKSLNVVDWKKATGKETLF